jgi:hypothetical protein
LREVPIPGQYVGLQALHVLADGWMWAQNGISANGSMVSDGVTARRVDVAGAGDGVWTYDDGDTIYALARRPGLPVAIIQVVRGAPVLGQADAVRTPAGQRFAAYLRDPNAGAPLIIELPDAPHPLRLVVPYRSVAAPQERVGAFVEAEAAADGTIYVLLAGSTSGPHSANVAGFVTVSPDGEVSQVLAVPALTSGADPGGAAHLHVDPVTNRPSLIVVGNDAVRVYRLDR